MQKYRANISKHCIWWVYKNVADEELIKDAIEVQCRPACREGWWRRMLQSCSWRTGEPFGSCRLQCSRNHQWGRPHPPWRLCTLWCGYNDVNVKPDVSKAIRVTGANAGALLTVQCRRHCRRRRGAGRLRWHLCGFHHCEAKTKTRAQRVRRHGITWLLRVSTVYTQNKSKFQLALPVKRVRPLSSGTLALN